MIEYRKNLSEEFCPFFGLEERETCLICMLLQKLEDIEEQVSQMIVGYTKELSQKLYCRKCVQN